MTRWPASQPPSQPASHPATHPATQPPITPIFEFSPHTDVASKFQNSEATSVWSENSKTADFRGATGPNLRVSRPLPGPFRFIGPFFRLSDDPPGSRPEAFLSSRSLLKRPSLHPIRTPLSPRTPRDSTALPILSRPPFSRLYQPCPYTLPAEGSLSEARSSLENNIR